MSLSIALMNAVSGLHTNSRALDITAQNVSNVNTEGYSRKIVHQQAVVIAGQGGGVQIAEVSRTVNEFMIREVRTATSQMGEISVKDDFLSRIQDLFGTLASDSSPALQIAELASTMQALADTPENASLRTELVERARLLVQNLGEIADDIEKFRVEIDRDIGEAVSTVNTQLALIQELNLKIAQNVALNQGASELQDQRDIAMNKVAELMGYQQFPRNNGEIVMLTSSGRSLLDRTVNTLSHAPITGSSPLTTWADGGISPITLSGVDITTEITTGRIGGLLELRDEMLPNLHSQFQELTEALHDQINTLHNQGTAYPGMTTVTGSRSFAGTDPLNATGDFRVTITDTSGVVVETLDIDMSTTTSVNAMLTAINGMASVSSAALNAAGKIVITPTAGSRIAFNEMDSAVTAGSKTMGASAFFGLNDFFVSRNEYDDYSSAHRTSRTTALGQTGQLSFAGGFGTTTVNYAAGNSLDDIAESINLNGVLSGAGITASVIADGSGYRLRVIDADGDNMFITESGGGNLLTSLNIRARDAGIVGDIDVRSDILADPSLVARGTLSNDPALAAGDVALTAGDKTAIQAMADRFNQRLTFDATNLLAGTSATLSEYGSEILALNATQANTIKQSLNSRQILLDNLTSKTASISGVNLDEEMSRMIILENAYAASARVITVTQNLFDLLSDLMR
ncbi:MAG: flagellar hook-associated protein FlgK [Alphaproteobacteria bacterium]|nr:flagellar hook-associated protein FlgK [Alphaproteobacteria bacterium]